jgi:hypothetical protein
MRVNIWSNLRKNWQNIALQINPQQTRDTRCATADERQQVMATMADTDDVERQ